MLRPRLLNPTQALSCLVPFLPADLGLGVFARLQGDAWFKGVTIKLRGNKSAGRHDNPKEHRRLAVYGTDPAAVQRVFLNLHDTAVACGVDSDKFNLPDTWRAALANPRAKARPKTRPARATAAVAAPGPPQVVAADACRPAAPGAPRAEAAGSDRPAGAEHFSPSAAESSSPTTPHAVPDAIPKVRILTLGVRFLSQLAARHGADKATFCVAQDIVDDFRGADPGADRVANVLSLFGETAVHLAEGMFMSDPEKQTRHVGMSAEVQQLVWRQNESFFRGLFWRVRAALQPTTFGAIRTDSGNDERTLVFYCKSGRHRSVAGAEICKGVLLRAGYEVKVEHLCQYWWRWVRCQYQHGRHIHCASCTPEATPEKTAIYDTAFDMWQRM